MRSIYQLSEYGLIMTNKVVYKKVLKFCITHKNKDLKKAVLYGGGALIY